MWTAATRSASTAAIPPPAQSAGSGRYSSSTDSDPSPSAYSRATGAVSASSAYASVSPAYAAGSACSLSTSEPSGGGRRTANTAAV